VPPLPVSHRGGGGAREPAGTTADPRVTDDDIAELSDIAKGLMYAGFNTQRIRKQVKETIPARELIKILIAAAFVGNSPERLAGKVVDPDQGREMLALLARHKIKSRGAVGANDLTLARVAASCAPLYYRVRLQVAQFLQDQNLNTGVDKVWQSPSLAVYSDRVPNMMNWLVAFGRQIKPRAESDESSESRTKMFRDISVNNRSTDPYLDPANLDKSIPELVALMYVRS